MHALPVETDRDSESVRLFKSDFMEFFTHISPITILVIWLPVIIALLAYAISADSSLKFPWYIPSGALVGAFLWTSAEYLLHRFFFHFEPRAEWQKRIMYLAHGVHHDTPQDKTRLVMPPPVSIPLALVFYGFFYLVLATLLNAPAWVNPVMAGFLIGYLIYDLTHYATHHFPMRHGYWRFIKRYHMMHHYKDPDTRYGVSSPVWDWVFGTRGEGA